MVVSERAASADARGSGREGDMGDATLSTRRACGVHCCACAHGRTLRSGRRQSPRGRDTAEQHSCPWKPAEAGEKDESVVYLFIFVLCMSDYVTDSASVWLACIACGNFELACFEKVARTKRPDLVRKLLCKATVQNDGATVCRGCGPTRRLGCQ